MADSFNVWPGGVPTSYSGETFPLPKTESLPALYGIDLANPFFLSFLAGSAFVVFFSIARFNRRSSDPLDPVTAESKLLERLTPADLRDGRLIAQAYALYVSVLFGIYAALTFYGRIILDWANNVLPTAGYTDTSKFDYSSPQWPLMVALAMVGVLPVLPPVEAFEVRLRYWTHRAVGIPLTIYRHSEAMRTRLRRDRGVQAGELPDFDKQVPAWVKEIADPFSINYAFEARADLEKLTPWTMTGRGEWPTGESNRAVEALFDEHTITARTALLNFEDQIMRKNPAVPKPVAGESNADRHVRHRDNLRKSWEIASKQVIDARDELLALLAIGAEKQSDYSLIGSPDLRHLITEAMPVDRFQRGPQVSVVLLLPLLLLAFGFAIRFGWHAPNIGRSATTVSVVVLSALYEVLLIVVLFLLPLMAALNYRFWRKVAYRGRWQELKVLNFEQQSMMQVVFAGLLALVVSATGLTLLAVAQAGILARSTAHFNRLLFDSALPLLPVALSLSGVSVIYCLIVLYSVEEKEQGADRLKLFGLGLICGLAILAYQMAHLYFWYDGRSLCGPTIFTELVHSWPVGSCKDPKQTSPSPQDFSQYYNLVSILINAAIGFASIAWFLPDRNRVDPDQTAAPPAQATPVDRTPGPAALAGLVLGLLLAMVATAAVSQDNPAALAAEGAQTDKTPTVVVGFRADAPPFSSIKHIGSETRYDGYLIDLCSKIFSPDTSELYRVIKTEVTAEDRFRRLLRNESERWKPGEPTTDAKVDLLCDPVTLRYASERYEPPGGRRTDGIFSPIVYVTGVSYLERSKSGTGTPTLGFVVGTTTGKVVLQACEHDAFRNRESDGTQSDENAIRACALEIEEGVQKFNVQTELEEKEHAKYDMIRALLQGTGLNPDPPECTPTPDAQIRKPPSGYRFCFFRNHTSAARWFCGAQSGASVYYFGDKDLIVGQVESMQQAAKCDKVNMDAPFYSYEPYSLLISPIDNGLVRFVQRRIYEIFSDRSEALGMFASNFKGKAMSVPLASLFLLNGVEDEDENARQANP